MRYKAKLFKSHKRKMTNGTFEYFNIIRKPNIFNMKTLHKNSKESRKK